MKRSLQYWCGQLKWITILFFKLMYAMGFSSGTWMINAVRMIIFGTIISFHMFPNCLWYITSPSIIRHVHYRSSRKAKVEVLKTLLAAIPSHERRKSSRRHHRQRFGQTSDCPSDYHYNTNECGDPYTSGCSSSLEGSVDNTIVCDQIVQRLRKLKGHKRKRISSRLVSKISGLFEGLDLTNERDFAKTDTKIEERRKNRVSNSGDQKNNGIFLGESNVLGRQYPGITYEEEEYLLSHGAEGPQADDEIVNHTTDDERMNILYSDGNNDDIDDLFKLAEEQFDDDDAKIHNRTFLDIFLPIPLHSLVVLKSLWSKKEKSKEQKKIRKFKIVVLFSGGAWIIGYYLWSGLLARFFAAAGYIAIVPDYRNFPQVEIPGMVDDFTDAISWVINHADKYNGDISDITIIGHSAGAHISMLMILREAKRCREQQEYEDRIKRWKNKHGIQNDGNGRCHSELKENVNERRNLINSAKLYNNTRTSRSVDVPSIPSASDVYNYGIHNGTFVMDQSSLLHVNLDLPGVVNVGKIRGNLHCVSNHSESSGPSYNAHLSQPCFPPKFNPAKDIKCYVGVSGIYDLFGLLPYLHGRGLRDQVMWRMAGLTTEELGSPKCTEEVKEEYLKAASPLWYFGRIIGTLGSAKLSLGLLSGAPLSVPPTASARSESATKVQGGYSINANDTSFEGDVEFLRSVMKQSASLSSASDTNNIGKSEGAKTPPAQECAARDQRRKKGDSSISVVGEDEIRRLIASLSDARVAEFLPRNIKFVHGVLDASAPISESAKMTSCLRISVAVNGAIRRIEKKLHGNKVNEAKDLISSPCDDNSTADRTVGANNAPVVQLVHIEGANHTDPILEELLCGKCYIIDLLSSRGPACKDKHDGNVSNATISPDVTVNSNLLTLKVPTTLSFGRKICPF